MKQTLQTTWRATTQFLSVPDGGLILCMVGYLWLALMCAMLALTAGLFVASCQAELARASRLQPASASAAPSR